MKKSLLFAILFIAFSCKGQSLQSTFVHQHSTHFNRIDTITTVKGIATLLKSINKVYSNVKLVNTLTFKDKECKCLHDSLHTTAFVKGDFDNNGYNDIMAMIQGDFPCIIFIFDSGDKYAVETLYNKYTEVCRLPEVIKTGNETYIRLHTVERKWVGKDLVKNNHHLDVIYKFGSFIEFNPAPNTHQIHNIAYTTTQCKGDCPVFSLDINENRSAVYNAISHNQHDGVFSGTIAQDDFQRLISLLNYIDFSKLDSTYETDATCQPSCYITITYDDGKIKKITDYGQCGTYGLTQAYRLLFDMRYNQKWYLADK